MVSSSGQRHESDVYKLNNAQGPKRGQKNGAIHL